MIYKNHFRNFDFALLIITLGIFCMGLLSIYSATHTEGMAPGSNLVMRQITWMAIALVFLVLILKFDYQNYIDLSHIFYVVCSIFLVLILFMGRGKYGAGRWFYLGIFAFQPSELAKLSLILLLASVIGRRQGGQLGIGTVLVCLSLTLFTACLVAVEPDLGTAIVFAVIFFSMLFVGGARLKYLLLLFLSGLATAPFLWHALKDYQKERFLVFLDPNADPLGAGYTVIQSKIAIGSGSLFGKGWLSGTQNKLNFLPERHSDFIFSVIGEEWGFLGSVLLIGLYFILIKKAIAIGSRTNDQYARLIVAGIVAMLAFHIVVNISMALGVMPVVGLPLPLISYGGSSLITTMASIALLLNIDMRKTRF